LNAKDPMDTPDDNPDQPATVLIVDDDPGARLLLGTALELAGFRVATAADGAAALDALRAMAPERVGSGSAGPRSGLPLSEIALHARDKLRAAEALAGQGISVEVVDLRTIRPLDRETIVASARRTGRVVVADGGWKSFGVAAEIVATLVDGAFDALRRAPKRITFPDAYVPTTPALARHYYPTAATIANAVRELVDLPPLSEAELGFASDVPIDVPNPAFRGPF